MNLPDGVDIVAYKRIVDMPVHVRAAVRMMGMRHYSGHLRKLANGDPGHQLVTAAVLFYEGTVVGWAAYYYADCIGQKGYRAVSLWVQTKYRGNGFGRLLSDYAYRKWNRFGPETFKDIEFTWYRKDAGLDRTHLRPASLLLK